MFDTLFILRSSHRFGCRAICANSGLYLREGDFKILSYNGKRQEGRESRRCLQSRPSHVDTNHLGHSKIEDGMEEWSLDVTTAGMLAHVIHLIYSTFVDDKSKVLQVWFDEGDILSRGFSRSRRVVSLSYPV